MENIGCGTTPYCTAFFLFDKAYFHGCGKYYASKERERGMDMSNKEYQDYVEGKAAKSPLALDMLKAFAIGGLICVIGQGIMSAAMAAGLPKNDAGTVTTIALVGLSALLTGLNLYSKIARHGGAGTLVPVTGFANAVVSPAIDFRSEGFVTGMAAKMFQVAGPVIVFGTLASAVYGVVLLALSAM